MPSSNRLANSANILISAGLNIMVFLLLAAVILAAAWQENDAARKRAHDRVVSELAELQGNYGSIATDYGWWNEARDRIERARDHSWADENIGQWLGRTAKLAQAYAFDGDGAIIYASLSKRPPSTDFADLLAAARAVPPDNPQPVTAFVLVDGRPMLLAASVLRPMVPVTQERYRAVLALAWEMDTVLERLRATTLMPGLEWGTPGQADGDGLDIVDITGRAILRLVWQAEQPGHRFAAAVLPTAGLVLAVLSAIGWGYWFRGRRHLRALVAAEEARLRLLAAISHDLRQPLQSMALFTAALEAEVSSEQGGRALDLLRQGIERMGELLAAILKLARLDMQHVGAVDMAPVALGEVMRGIVEELEPQAAVKGLSLRHVPSSVLARSDAVMLAAVLRNLVSNAIRYTHAGRVLVGVRRRQGGAEIWVCDTGIGIADHQQALVFEEFFQVGNPSRDHTHGVGLGLSIVQRLARLLDCRIRVRSQPGKGSLFAVLLPKAS